MRGLRWNQRQDRRRDKIVADELRKLLDGELPAKVAQSHDPFDVLRYAGSLDAATVHEVEKVLRHLELAAIAQAPATPHAAKVIKTLFAQGHGIVLVSNNSDEAVQAYLDAHGLEVHVLGVSARSEADPSLLKPHPHLLNQAMRRWRAKPTECIMIGDSASDIEAAQTAGTLSVAYANKPGKRARFEELRPDSIIDSVAELA